MGHFVYKFMIHPNKLDIKENLQEICKCIRFTTLVIAIIKPNRVLVLMKLSYNFLIGNKDNFDVYMVH